jgi:hypothetical protein
VVVTAGGRPFAVMGFTVAEGKIVEIDAIAEPDASEGSPQLFLAPNNGNREVSSMDVITTKDGAG